MSGAGIAITVALVAVFALNALVLWWGWKRQDRDNGDD